VIRNAGIGVEAVSPGELRVVRRAGFRKEQISFTCSNITVDELRYAARMSGRVHLDSLHQIEVWGKYRLGRNISLRLNQGIGSGHHAHVVTGGPESKFGVTLVELPRAQELAERYGLVITSLQQHIGSNVLDDSVLLIAAEKLLDTASRIPGVAHLDFGGGFGVPYRPSERPLNLSRFGRGFLMRTRAFEKETGRRMSYSFEPGRFVVAESGILLAEVTDIKRTSRHIFAGVNASALNHLVRAILYGAYHHIENISRPRGKLLRVTVAGNICESSDIFAKDRLVAMPKIGDVLAIRNAGAYVMSMASLYNLRALPREILISKNGAMKDVSFSKNRYI
jgi:diaminopimelate decarboxylase